MSVVETHKKKITERNKKEAPLTLRGQRGVAEIFKGTCKYLGASLAQRYVYFSSGCGFMVGLGKPKLCTKFEVASFSHCANIERNLQILGNTPSAGPRLPFLLRVVLSWALANSRCVPNLKSLAPAVAEIL